MKKTVSVLLALLLLLSCLPAESAQAGESLSIVTTIFPIYDWTRAVLGEESDAQVILLLDSGVDLHSFQPTVADMMSIATCDLFLYVGGESDEWVEDALAEAANPDQKALCLLAALGDGAKEEEEVEGMEHSHDHDEDHDHDTEEVEYDEHIWLSLRNAHPGGRTGRDHGAGPDPAQRHRGLCPGVRHAL